MNKSNVLTVKQQYLVVVLTTVLSILVVWAMASGATTISTNIVTGGSLEVGTTSTLTGLSTHTAGAILVASSTAVSHFNTSGQLNASSTMTVDGAAQLKSTLAVTSASTLTGGALLVASSTAVANFYINGNLQSWGNVFASSTLVTQAGLKGFGVGTSTPRAEFAASSVGTTTVLLHTQIGVSGCIQLKSTAGTWYRLYIDNNDAENGTTTRTGGIVAVWEEGACR